MSEFPRLNQESRAYEQMKFKLGDAGMSLLEGQLETWAELNSRPLESPLRTALASGDTRLPEGTLLHSMGMYGFSADALKGVSEKGIVSGELIGISEDSETHGCADFFRVPHDTTIAGYVAWAKETVISGNIRRKRGDSLVARGIAYIVDPHAEGMDRILENDGYRNGAMAGFIHPPSGRTAEDTAAILGGVPRGAIAGIIVNDKLLGKTEVGEALATYFPDVPVFTHS